jgi:RNA polymerase primary sigma factor
MSMRQLKITKSITNRESQSLDKYLQEIGKISTIAPEEEVILAQKIRAGDEEAEEKLTRANLRFVVSVAKQYQHQGLSLSDLINEGNLGLIKAARRYDETRGFKFISYAVWWIRQSILQALAEQGRIVKLPIKKVGLTGRINKAFNQLEQEFEREPTADEIAYVLDMDPEEVAQTILLSTRHKSLDMSIGENDEGTLLDVTENKNISATDEETDSVKIDIERSLSVLNTKQKDVIHLFYGIGTEGPLILEDIGEKLGLTRERVRQIKDKAIDIMRTHKNSEILRKYLG